SFSARIYAKLDRKELEYVAVLGTGTPRRGSTPFVQPFGLMGRVPVAFETRFLGTGHLMCSAMTPGGASLVVVRDAKREDLMVTLRWYDRDGDETASRDLGEGLECAIALRHDGSSLVWHAPRRLLAFDADAKLLWRAELAADAVAVGLLSDGDIAALHPAGTGVNVVRYRVR